MRETCFQSLDWEDPLEKGKGYPLQYSGLEKSMGLQKVRHDCVTFTGELWKRRTNPVWRSYLYISGASLVALVKCGFPGCTSGNARDCITRLPTQELLSERLHKAMAQIKSLMWIFILIILFTETLSSFQSLAWLILFKNMIPLVM